MKTRNNVKIGKVEIGEDKPVRLIAELGVNHLGNFQRMKDMIFAANESGADILKFQTYNANSRYDPKKNPKGQKFIDLLKDWQFNKAQERELWEYANSLGCTIFTSVYDPDIIEFTEELGSSAYKIAAFEIVNLELIEAVAQTGKPVVISRGMSSKEELDNVVSILERYQSPYIILHCISSYPLEKTDSHLRMIHSLREWYNCPIGHSDHTHGTEIPPFAVAAGACVIEKHFSITPKYRESDNFFSITPNELKEIKWKVDQVTNLLGRGNITCIETENYMWDFRKMSDSKSEIKNI